VVANQGRLTEGQVQDFFAAGYSEAQLLEVITGVAVKTISTCTNHLADTPLDSFLEPQRGTSQQDRQAAS